MSKLETLKKLEEEYKLNPSEELADLIYDLKADLTDDAREIQAEMRQHGK